MSEAPTNHRVFSTSKDAVIAYQRTPKSEPQIMVIVGENPHRTIAQARDLQQALAQAIAAAEVLKTRCCDSEKSVLK